MAKWRRVDFALGTFKNLGKQGKEISAALAKMNAAVEMR